MDFQKRHGLVADGMAGPKTRDIIAEMLFQYSIKCWPMNGYKGRKPIITSGYGPRDGGFHNGGTSFSFGSKATRTTPSTGFAGARKSASEPA